MKPGALFGAANRARLAVHLLVLWKLFKHPDTPRAPKLVAIAVLAYALSPIDLIPDFIPVLGLLDDLLLLPLGIALAVKLTPEALWQARLREAEASPERLPKMLWGAALIALSWLLCAGAFGGWLWHLWGAA
ncbi:YkvA family protein [Methylibium sp.]|uniref:YkvA family protein n=1 Tax=Methylibium sp. TaxID=2067992 RepID=UPI003D12AB08